MKRKLKLDLHGVKHQDVELILENFFFWENQSPTQLIEIILGNSPAMQKFVTKWLDSNEFSYYIPASNVGIIYVN